MFRKKQHKRGRLLITGAVLLVLLVAGVIVSGRVINRRAVQMSDRIVTQIGESHWLLLQGEIDRSVQLLETSARYVATHDNASPDELRILCSTLLETDAKAGSLWFAAADGNTLRRYGREAEATTETIDNNRQRLCDATRNDTVRSAVLEVRGHGSWVLVRRVTDRRSRCRLCGVDYPLDRFYLRMTEQNPLSRSSATLFDAEGVIVYHPDSGRLGRPSRDEAEIEAVRRVRSTGRTLVTSAQSDYLGVAEQRIYYPIEVAGERWVAAVGIPRLVIEQEIDDFHLYTILTALGSVLFFAVLLVVAQRRWRREYDLRRRTEQESAQLQLQQLLEQIDPHFLFNSLNSLYALIRCNPDEAREFTLTLARVYRRVLERRKQVLATLDEEIDFTRQYFSLQKIRFGESLMLSIEVDPALGRRRIPSMSLQTLVENAVKHNRISDRNPLRIEIRTEGEWLVIENNLTPRDDGDAESLGVGLERIRSVYRFHTDREPVIESCDGLFRCRLPLLPAEE